MSQSFGSRPLMCFEVEKVIGVSSDGNYQVQWAPAWVSKFHLVGCEHLIQEFLQQQQQQEEHPQQQLRLEEDQHQQQGLEQQPLKPELQQQESKGEEDIKNILQLFHNDREDTNYGRQLPIGEDGFMADVETQNTTSVKLEYEETSNLTYMCSQEVEDPSPQTTTSTTNINTDDTQFLSVNEPHNVMKVSIV